MKCYKNITTDEVVYKEEAKEHALYELGLMDKGELVIVPRGKNGTYTIEQLQNIDATVEGYFSGNWTEEEIKEVEEPSVFELIKEECEIEDVRS